MITSRPPPRPGQKINRKKVHAMTLNLSVLCGTPGATRTSICMDAKDEQFWKLVTCERCRRKRLTV